MHTRSMVALFLLTGSLAFSCSKGGSSGSGKDGKSADAAGMTAYTEDGKSLTCAPPETACEDSKEASLAFKDACSVGGFRIQLCGCQELCTGNVNGAKSGYDAKNKEKECGPPKEGCEEKDSSAAFQDACSEAGYQLIECGCDWLCSGKLKEALPDATPPEEKKDDEKKDGDGDKKKDGDKKGDKKKGK